MNSGYIKISNTPVKKPHEFWIRETNESITYIQILDYNIELGFKCELIKLYSDHYNKTITYLKPSYFENYKMCSFIDYFDIENKIYKYESDLEDYKKNLFKEIFDNEIII
jgi:hypothetical protein